ncbi:MAG: glycosyltransferase family 4 protein, partial [Anaerolineae bacterium]|nr:glycosyltransferase family 4 protein [Anaerolineae bacterium]
SGAERHLLILLPALRARGVDVSLLLLEDPAHPVADMAAELEAAGVPVRRIPIYRHVDLPVIGRLRRALRDLRPQIVHTHLIHADLYGMIAAKSAGVRTVITSRHNDDTFRRRQPARALNRVLWRFTSAGIAISHAIARFCVEVEGAPARKLTTIHYGQPLHAPDRKAAGAALRGELSLAPDTRLVGMVCRLIEQKGVVYGIRAFARVAPQFPATRLIIAGEGDQRAALESEAQTLGIGDRVHFLGWRDDAASVLAALDVLLMPSLWEGFGLVMLEAMAQLVPIVGSAVSAIPEVVADGETGILVPPRDTAAIADALALLLGDPALCRHMGLQGQDRVETVFSVERMVAETVAVYQRCAGSS